MNPVNLYNCWQQAKNCTLKSFIIKKGRDYYEI